MSALRFTAGAGTLYDTVEQPVTTAGVEYYVKIRLSPTVAPAGTDNRGFTWNPTTQTWVQEREDWINFPIVTTAAGGAITAGSNSWYYFRFGDTTKAGTYYILVSLQPVGGGSGTTQNNASPPAITVLDTAGTIANQTDGFVIHNGVATGVTGKRAEATQSGAPTTVWALTRTTDTASTAPLQIMPDLWTGANAVNGDFALGVPAGSAFDARLQNTIWPVSASSFTGTLADVNIALGAAETTPPSAPASLTGAPRDAKAVLTWGAATDNTAVTSYIVYRWTDPLLGSGYTGMPQAIATVSDALTYTDSSATNGTTYHYLVRAEDAATNVGPRSATADVTPDGTAPAPVTSFTATPGDAQIHLSWVDPTDSRLRRRQDRAQRRRRAGRPDRRHRGLRRDRDPLRRYRPDQRRGLLLCGLRLRHGGELLDRGDRLGRRPRRFHDAHAERHSDDRQLGQALGAERPAHQRRRRSGPRRPGGPPGVHRRGLHLGDASGCRARGRHVDLLGEHRGALSEDAVPALLRRRRDAHGHGSARPSPSPLASSWARRSRPSSVKKGAKFTAYGALTPQQPENSKTVKIKCYLRSNGKWVLKKTVTATNAVKGSATRYSARFSLPTRGSWKLTAYSAATSKYAATTSGDEYMKVK